jgi:hypothetical protein
LVPAPAEASSDSDTQTLSAPQLVQVIENSVDSVIISAPVGSSEPEFTEPVEVLSVPEIRSALSSPPVTVECEGGQTARSQPSRNSSSSHAALAPRIPLSPIMVNNSGLHHADRAANRPPRWIRKPKEPPGYHGGQENSGNRPSRGLPRSEGTTSRSQSLHLRESSPRSNS